MISREYLIEKTREIDEVVELSDEEKILAFDEFMNGGKFIESGMSEADLDPKQVKKGIKSELEHTTNKDIARKIALDHLAEIPNYYDLLEQIEGTAEETSDETAEETSDETAEETNEESEDEEMNA